MASDLVSQYCEAIRNNHGLITKAADTLGVSRQAVYAMRTRHPEVRRAIDEARERTTDEAESVLYNQMKAGNMTAVIFYLKTQAKNRGYIERVEIDKAVREEVEDELESIFLELRENLSPGAVAEIEQFITSRLGAELEHLPN